MPDPKKLNRADQIALGTFGQRSYRDSIVEAGQASTLDMDKMRRELGDEFQLHKGEQYLVDTYNTKVQKKRYDEAKRKADEQGFWGELWGFTAQALGGEVILGSLEGIGYLLDFDHWVDRLSGGEGDWGNWFSDMMADGQEWIAEKAPIYMDPDAEKRDFWDNLMYTDGWWAQNGVSVASALSLLIPVAGWARGVGMAGKGVALLGKMGRAGKWGKTGVKSMNLVDDLIKALPAASKNAKRVADGVHKAVVSRQLENHMEAAGVYQEQYDKFIAQGMSEEEARKAASEGAAFTYKAGWAMLLTDIPQYLMLGRGMRASKAVLSNSVRKASGQSLKKTVALNIGEYAKQFATEGFEEAYQFVVAEEGKHHADIIAGTKDANDTSFADRLSGYVEDSELWTAAFFGGLGGAVFQAAGNPTTEFINKKLLKKGEGNLTWKEARIQEIMNRKQVISANVKAFYEAVEAGDERATEAAKARIGFDLGINSAQVGNWALAKGTMEQLKNATAKEKAEYGIDEEFNDNIDGWIKDAEKAVELYTRNEGKFEASTVGAITYRQFMIHKYSERLPQVKKQIEDLKQQVPLINEMSEAGKHAFEAQLQVKAQQRYVKAAKWKLNNMKMPEDEKKSLEESISLAEEAVNQYKAAVQENIKQGLTKNERVTLNTLDGATTEELSKAQAEVQWMEHYLGQYSDEATKMASKEYQQAVKASEDMEAEKLAKKAKSSKKQEQVQKEKDKLNGALSEEEQELSQEYVGSDVNTSMADLSARLDKEPHLWNALDPEAKKAVQEYRDSKAKTNENPIKSEEEMEASGLDLSEVMGQRDAAADHKKQSNNAVDHIDAETPVNPETDIEWKQGDDTAQGTVTTLETALAWLSPNNPWTREDKKTPVNKALAAFLESNNSLGGMEVVFTINEEWLNADENRGDKAYNQIKQDLAAGRIPKDIGFVPITATLYRNGEPFQYAGETLSMSLHESDFFFKDGQPRTEHSESQKATLERHKREIVDGILNGKTVKAAITGKTGGNINVQKTNDGNFAKLPISDALGNMADVNLVYGNSNAGYVDADGNLVPDLMFMQAGENGAIYAMTETANGTPFPLRLHVENLSRTEAEVIYKLYLDILSDETMFSKPLSDEIRNMIETSKDKRISGLTEYLDLGKMAYKDLLAHLVYEGKKTEAKDTSRLFTYPPNKKTGQPALLTYGTKKISVENLNTPQGKQLVVEHLIAHRRRQIDVKMLNNPKYKTYLDANRILTTNAQPTPTKSLFIQPTVSYSNDLIVETTTNEDSKVEAPQISNETKEAGVKVETKAASEEEFQESSAFDLTTILPDNDMKNVSPENQEQVQEYKADEAEEAKKKTRKARIAQARKNNEDGKKGAFKVFQGIPQTESIQEIKDAAEHIKSLLPSEVGVELAPGYVQVLSQGYVALGLFKNGMITLSEKAPKSVAYHEAFHAVFRTMHNVSQQMKLIEEAKKTFEKPTDADLNLLMEHHDISRGAAEMLFYEEILADEFGDYMTNPEYAKAKYGYSAGIKGLFQKLMDWINNVFRNKKTVRKLFRDINSGKYKNKTPLISRKVAFKAHKTFSAADVREITQQLTYAAFANVTSLDDVRQNYDAQLVIDTLLHAYEQAADMENAVGDEIMDRIDLLFNENNELDQFWVDKIDEFVKVNFDLKKVNKIDQTEDVDEENLDDKERSDFLKSSYELSGKQNATATVKFIVAMTPKIEGYREGAPIYAKSSLLGLPQFNDFGTTYNTLEKLLAGTVSIMEGGVQQDPLQLMRNKLEQEFRYKPELKFILDRLSKMDEDVQTQFHYTFSRQKGNYLDHLLEGKPGNLVSKIGAADIEAKERVIRDSWATMFQNNFGRFTPEGQFEYNSRAISAFKAIRNDFKKLLNRDMLNKGPVQPDTIKALDKTLKVLGVSISPKAFQKIMDGYMPPKTLSPQMAMLFSLRNFEQDLTNATNALLSKSGALNDKTNLLMDEDSFFKNILARTEADFVRHGGENSFVGPDGNQYFIYQDNNSVSKIIAQMKAGDTSFLEKLKKSDYATHSLWLKELLDENNGPKAIDKFQTALYGNLKKLNTGDRGDKAGNLKPADQFIDVFNKYLHGVYVGLAEADKAQQTYFIGPEVQPAGVSFAPATGSVFFNNKTPRAARILAGYLADELMRMETARKAFYGYTDTNTGETHDALPEDQQILYYHYHIDKNGNRVPGNAFESFLFPDIGDKLEELGLKDSNTGEIYPLTVEAFDNNPELLEYIKEKFLDAVNKDIGKALEYGLIERIGNGYQNRNIALQHMKDRGGDVIAAIADYTLNSIIANVEQTKLFNGDPALYKTKVFEKDGVTKKDWTKVDMFADFKKRIPAAIAAGKDFRIFNEPDGTVAVRSHYFSATVDNIDGISSEFFGKDGKFNQETLAILEKNSNLTRAQIKEIFKPYLKVNQTDAQAWITLEAYRERLRGLGKWTKDHENAYVKAVDNKPLTLEDTKLLAQPLKTVHAELMSTPGNVMSMQYNKQSEAVLLPFMTKGTALDQLREAMERDEIDHVIVLDGKKVGAMGVTKIADAAGNINAAKDIKLTSVPLSYNNLFLQQDLPSKGIKPTLVGSQGTKNVLSVVNLDGAYFDGELTGRELVDEFHRTIAELSNKGIYDFKAEIGFNEETGQLETDENGVLKYNKLLQREFLGEISDNHMEALDSDVDLDALPIKDKIQNKGNAMITKKAVKLKQLGGALVQLSDFGFVGTEVALTDKVKDGIVWFKDPTERLKPMTMDIDGNVAPAQVLLPYGKLMQMLEAHGLDYQNMTHEEIKALIDPEALQGLSYRIPNQGPSSNDAFEIVGVLPPQAGDTIVAFSAITTKTGSDFDIDKAFIILPNFYFNEDTNRIEKVRYNPEKRTKKGLENYRLELMREMLLHPEAYTSVMAPLDDPWLEDLAKSLYPETASNGPLDFFAGTTQMETKMTFDNAKNLVGVIANHMTHHALALSEGLYFTDYYLGKGVTNENGNTSISNKLDEDGKPIENTLGAFMNAIVDAAKDPFISRANINQITANTAFMLARAGVSREWIVAFMGQPIIKEYVKQTALREGRFAEKIKVDKTGRPMKTAEVVLEAFGSELTNFEMYQPEMSLQGSENGTITLSLEELTSTLNTVNSADAVDGAMYAKLEKETQEKILAQFLQWQRKAKALNDVIKVSKADVDGATRNLTRAKLAENLLHKVVVENQVGNVDKLLGYTVEDGEIIFGYKTDTRMTGTYFENSVRASREIFKGLFLSTTEAAERALDSIAAHAGYIYMEPNAEQEALADKINSELYALTASDTDAFRLEPLELRQLLFGTPGKVELGENVPRRFSIADRINQAKSSALRDNLLIQALQTRPTYGTTPAMVFLPSNETTKMVKDDLYLAWMELFDPQTGDPALAEDLMKYAFYSSGFSRSVGNFYDHIPMQKLAEKNYSEQIKAKKIAYNNEFELQEKEDLVYKNLYKDNRLVPVVPEDVSIELKTGDNKYTFPLDVGFIIMEGVGENYIAGKDVNGRNVFKRFVKREKPQFDNARELVAMDYQLYQLQGYTEAGGAVYIATNKLGYNAKGNMIKEYIGSGEQSIFPENNVSLPQEILPYLNAMAPVTLPVTPYDKTAKKRKQQPDEGREDRLNFCVNKQ